MGRLQQTAVRWPRGSVALSRALHPPRRHFQPPPARARSQRRHLQVEGLPHRRSRAIQVDDARYRRVHPALPDACLAARLPPYPLLRLAHEPNPRREYRTRPRTACSAIHPDRCHQGCQRQARRAKSARAPLSLLRQPHAHHRDFLARATAEVRSLAKGQDRHLMMPTPVLDTHGNTTAWVGSCPTAPPLASPRRVVAQPQPKNTKSRRSKRPLLDRASTYVPPTRQNGCRCPFASSQGHLSSWPNPHSTHGTVAAHIPRFRALALFGRRPTGARG